MGWKSAAAGGGGGGPTVVYKTADESVTSSVAQQDDDHLTIAVAANDVWVIQCYLRLSAHASGDWIGGFSSPAGSTGWSAVLGDGIGATTFSNVLMDNQSAGLAAGGLAGGLGAGNHVMIIVTGYVAVGGSSGNVALSWAQRVSNGTPTILKEGSFMVAHNVT